MNQKKRTEFSDQIDEMFAVGVTKGYTLKSGLKVQDVIQGFLSGPHQHELGEAFVKLVRYTKKGNPEDLIKAAAWIKSVWESETWT